MNFRLLLFIFCLASCVQIPSVADRISLSDKIALKIGWQSEDVITNTFILRAYYPRTLKKSDVLNVYIEGDGLAWVNASTPSFNPTPINPLALKLALLDTNASAYLARPCQFVGERQQRGCAQKYWTSHRFAPEVIAASNEAVSQLKVRFMANKVRLIGYSGGGAVAALIAARRDDVLQLVTIAGNLDHAAWTQEHHISSLSGSLNAADAWQSLRELPQRHYVGGKDAEVDESIALSYAARFPKNKTPSINVIPIYDHHCCWELIWPKILASQFGNI